MCGLFELHSAHGNALRLSSNHGFSQYYCPDSRRPALWPVSAASGSSFCRLRRTSATQRSFWSATACPRIETTAPCPRQIDPLNALLLLMTAHPGFRHGWMLSSKKRVSRWQNNTNGHDTMNAANHSKIEHFGGGTVHPEPGWQRPRAVLPSPARTMRSQMAIHSKKRKPMQVSLFSIDSGTSVAMIYVW